MIPADPYAGLGPVSIVRANALDLPLPDASADLICTSPPYWSLRSYQDGGQHYDGQIGSEATPDEFVTTLLAATREMVRVLKPSGSLWVNLGDSYAGKPAGVQGQTGQRVGRRSANEPHTAAAGRDHGVIRPKSLMGLPWRYALRCIDELGLILRAEVIWSKCLSGGTNVYARINGREKVMMIKDLARCEPGTAELWTGEKWSPMLRCDPTPPTEGRAASSAAARQARYRGKPIPALAADLEIEFRNGERVGCTPNHKWPTARGLVRADELTVGDVVPSVRLASGIAAPAGLDDEMTGWLVGLYIAEGSRSEDMVQIASHTREHERFTRLEQIADAYDGRLAVHNTKGNAATANLSGKVIRAILDTYVGGRTAKDKRLAPACWRRSDAFLRAALNGYLSGDGHYDTKADRWTLRFTANDGLATDLRALAARLGYSLRLRRTVHKFDGREFPGWGGSLYLDPARRKRPDGEIVAIRQSRARQFWNIEIADEPHQFALAGGLLTCNSNGLPESVTDRVRRSHEQWFHFTVSPRYFSAVDEIREAYEGGSGGRQRAAERGTFDYAARGAEYGAARSATQAGMSPQKGFYTSAPNPLGKLPGSVREVPSAPLKVPAHLGVDHFAAFPPAWPAWIIRGWSPTGICVECGEGRRPVVASVGLDMSRPQARRAHELSTRAGLTNDHFAALLSVGVSDTGRGKATQSGTGKNTAAVYALADEARAVLGGYAREYLLRRPTGFVYECDCPTPDAPTRPAVILDPFGGTGTTAMAARALGRHGITVDLSMDYTRLARWRVNDPRELASVRGVAKPDPQVAGQADLFEGLTA